MVVVNDEWEYLVHHGIKGQHWGVRRFQNEDGTRTALGKKHEKTLDSYDSENNGKSNARLEYKQAKKDYDKSFKDYYSKSGQAYSLSKKKREDNDKRLNKTLEDAKKLDEAKKQYKAEKKQVKAESKAKAKEIRKNMSGGDKVASFMLGGRTGARAVANFMAKGDSKGAAYAKTFLYGNAALPVSAISRNKAANKAHFN